jgi:hypothetical protein
MDDKKSWSPESSSDPSAFEGDMHQVKRTFTRRLTESFKRDPNASVTRASFSAPDLHQHYDAEAAAQATAFSPLLRRLKGRHLQMIAIGGSIGTGLFVGSGKALAYGGPASLLLAFSLTGMMMYCTVQALGELAVLFPVAGSFAAYSTRFLDPAWGFAMGWNYAMQWLVVLPLEIVSASITVDYWVCFDSFPVLCSSIRSDGAGSQCRTERRVGVRLPRPDLHDQLLRRQRLRRSGIRLLHRESHGCDRIYVRTRPAVLVISFDSWSSY